MNFSLLSTIKQFISIFIKSSMFFARIMLEWICKIRPNHIIFFSTLYDIFFIINKVFISFFAQQILISLVAIITLLLLLHKLFLCLFLVQGLLQFYYLIFLLYLQIQNCLLPLFLPNIYHSTSRLCQYELFYRPRSFAPDKTSTFTQFEEIPSMFSAFPSSRIFTFVPADITVRTSDVVASPERSVPEVKPVVFRYVMVYYNRKRITTVNPDGLPPSIYRERFEVQSSVA